MLQPLVALAHDRVRGAFEAASDAFLATIGEVVDWEAPGLGEWTVRELVAHTLRAYTTIETYLAAPPSSAPMVDLAALYYEAVNTLPDVHAGVAVRGHEAGRLLTDPLPQAGEIAARVLATIRETPADRIVETFAGRMVFTEYLATRTIELTMHTFDIQLAIGLPPEMPAVSTSLCLDVLLPLADDTALLLAITGRGTVNVLG